MKRLSCLAFAGLAATLVSTQSLAVGRTADVTVVDRDSGEQLQARYHRGEWWVEGRPGARYALRIRNTLGTRVLAVASVDGINIVTGETAAPEQRGYVFDAWNGYDITGWRKSDAQIAAFEFTAVPRSYAARTGRAGNVGVIGVAVFRERPQPPLVLQQMEAPAAQSKSGRLAEAAADTMAARAASAPATAPAPALGTGHGQREASWVTQVAFERAQTQPDEVIRLRYDSHANLVARGVLPAARSPRPEPFPAGPQLGYVPDP